MQFINTFPIFLLQTDVLDFPTFRGIYITRWNRNRSMCGAVPVHYNAKFSRVLCNVYALHAETSDSQRDAQSKFSAAFALTAHVCPGIFGKRRIATDVTN